MNFNYQHKANRKDLHSINTHPTNNDEKLTKLNNLTINRSDLKYKDELK